MTAPMQVEIVRPKRSTSDSVAALVGHIAGYFLSGYVLMLSVPMFAAWHPGYWQAVFVVLAARLLVISPPTLDSWSRSATAKKRVR